VAQGPGTNRVLEQLVRALEYRQHGQPLALGAVIQEALAAKDLIPLREFLDAKQSVYHRSWSVWNLASWTMKQLGVADYLKRDILPPGDFVVLANVEEAGRTFSERSKEATGAGTRFERAFTKAHFLRTFNNLLVEGKQLSDTDAEVLLRFLARDKGAIAYDGSTIRIKSPEPTAAEEEPPEITLEDSSMAQIKELLANLTHQASLLTDRIAQLTEQAAQAARKQNRTAALAALRSRKLAEATLARRLAADCSMARAHGRRGEGGEGGGELARADGGRG
jgi:charged multivesicular body protein 7